MAQSPNLSAEVGKKGKISLYPLYWSAPNEYKSSALQQYKLFRLAVILRDQTLCCV